eukprot:249086_1
MQQPSEHGIYKFYFIATIESYEDIVDVDMRLFRREIMNLFNIKHDKNLKQLTIIKSNIYHYKVTCSYCKKITINPNSYINQLYNQFIENKYFHTIKQSLNLSDATNLISLHSQFKLLQKLANTANNSHKTRSRHNTHSNHHFKHPKHTTDKRRNTHDVQSNRYNAAPVTDYKYHKTEHKKIEKVYHNQKKVTTDYKYKTKNKQVDKGYHNSSQRKYKRNHAQDKIDRRKKTAEPPKITDELSHPWDDPNWIPPLPDSEPPTVHTKSPNLGIELQELTELNTIRLKPPTPNNDNSKRRNSSKIKRHKSSARSIVFLNSIRVQLTALNPGINPAKGLICFWIVIIIIILCCVSLLLTIDGYMVDIYIDMHNEGTFVWSLGGRNKTFKYLDDATCQACVFTSNDKIDQLFPIPNTTQYMKNAGYLLISSIAIIFICIICIFMILFERRNSHEPLYIKINCLNIHIPQRATVYFAWEIINSLSWTCIAYYIILSIYGYIETRFYLQNVCPSGLTCNVYVAPHFGLIALFCIGISISCCAFCFTKRLDPKLKESTLDLYFENPPKSDCTINWKQIFAVMNVLKSIFILVFIMTNFKDVGMINIIFYNESDSVQLSPQSPPKHIFYLQFQGLTNSNGITENSYLNVLNSNYYHEYMFGQAINGSNVTNITNIIPTNLQPEAMTMFTIGSVWYWWIWIIMCLNTLIVVPIIVYVILNFSPKKWIKQSVMGITFVGWLGHTILLIMYYYSYSYWFNNYANNVLQSELYEMTDIIFSVYWFPDWGILIAILLWIYLLKLIYNVSKAM